MATTWPNHCPAQLYWNIAPHLLLHLVKTRFAPVMADCLDHVNIFVIRHCVDSFARCLGMDSTLGIGTAPATEGYDSHWWSLSVRRDWPHLILVTLET